MHRSHGGVITGEMEVLPVWSCGWLVRDGLLPGLLWVWFGCIACHGRVLPLLDMVREAASCLDSCGCGLNGWFDAYQTWWSRVQTWLENRV